MVKVRYLSKRLAVPRLCVYLSVPTLGSTVLKNINAISVLERNSFNALNSMSVWMSSRAEFRFLEHVSVDVYYQQGLTLTVFMARQKRLRSLHTGVRWRYAPGEV